MGKIKKQFRTPWSILTIGTRGKTRKRRKPGKLSLTRRRTSSSKSVPRGGRLTNWLPR